MNNEKIEAMMKKGYHCAQTVFCYFADRYGLDHTKAKRTAQTLESGMMQAKTCGAVAAAHLVLGLEYGTDAPESRDVLLKKVNEFYRQFEEKKSTTICRELLGVDVTTKEGLEQAVEEKLIETVCPDCVMTSIEILEKMIRRSTQE